MSKLNLIAIIAIVASVSLFAGMVTTPIFAQGNSSGNNSSSNGTASHQMAIHQWLIIIQI